MVGPHACMQTFVCKNACKGICAYAMVKVVEKLCVEKINACKAICGKGKSLATIQGSIVCQGVLGKGYLLLIQVKNSGSHYSSIPPRLCIGKKANKLAQESESPTIYSTECRKNMKKQSANLFDDLMQESESVQATTSAMHIRHLTHSYCSFISTSSFKHDEHDNMTS